jgi:type IV secretion system protein VirB8
MKSDEYELNALWETERIAGLRTQARYGFIVGAAGVLVALLALTALVIVESSRVHVPVPIVVDRTTGETTTTAPLAITSVPAEEALDKANVTTFVRAREGYSWDFLQRDYNLVTRMSSPEVFKSYNAQFEGNDALDKRLGANVVWRVRVVNVRLELGGTASRKDAGRGGEAVVTFEREQRDVTRGTYEAPTRHVATLRYAYEPKAMRTEADRLDNPLGFVVTAYRTDSELKK